MAGSDVLGQSYWFGYSRLEKSINGLKSMKPFQIPNWNRSATVLKIIHYSTFVKSVRTIKNIIILQICCVSEIWIYMLKWFFLICMQIFLNDLSCLIKEFS